jgi:hypothetical protein
MNSSENTVPVPVLLPLPDQSAFGKQPLPENVLADIITAHNTSVNAYDLTNPYEWGDFIYNLTNRLCLIFGDYPSLENYDLSQLPELIRELICDIFENQYNLNRKNHVLYNQKTAYKEAKKLRVSAARANAVLPASVPRWRVVHIDVINNRIVTRRG